MFIGSNIHIGTLCLRAPAAGGASYLLDTYPAFVAYSVRLLSGSYAGYCMRVRRASDNAEADIGFADGWVDESAIATHCNGANGFVAKWYDQSGNGYDITEAGAAQPKIYNGTAVLKVNGKPALNNPTPGGSGRLRTATFSAKAVPITIFTVCKNATGAGNENIFKSGATGPQSWFDASGNLGIYSGTTLSDTGAHSGQGLYTLLFDATTGKIRKNGAETASGATGGNPTSAIELVLMNITTTAISDMQAWIFYDSDQTANFSAIETDINTAFSVY